MSAGALLALLVSFTAFCTLLLHLRWDVTGATRLGAMPLEDPQPSAEDDHVR